MFQFLGIREVQSKHTRKKDVYNSQDPIPRTAQIRYCVDDFLRCLQFGEPTHDYNCEIEFGSVLLFKESTNHLWNKDNYDFELGKKGIIIYVCFLYSSYSGKNDIKYFSSKLSMRPEPQTHGIRKYKSPQLTRADITTQTGLQRINSRPTL